MVLDMIGRELKEGDGVVFIKVIKNKLYPEVWVIESFTKNERIRLVGRIYPVDTARVVLVHSQEE